MFEIPRFNGMTLSEIASKLHRTARHTDQCHDAASAYYAPQECHGDIERIARYAQAVILAKAGLSAERFLELVDERCTPRFGSFRAQAWVQEMADAERRGYTVERILAACPSYLRDEPDPGEAYGEWASEMESIDSSMGP